MIPLLLVLPESPTREALSGVAAGTSPDRRNWLRWITLAAEYLGHIYATELRFLLGRAPRVPVGVFDRGDLPPAEVEFGELGLRALAEEIGASEGRYIDWEGSLDGAVRDLLERLWQERRVTDASSGHARAG